MTIPAAAVIPIIATVLELCLGLVALGLSAAPGWRRTRIMALLAFTCASFGAVNIVTTLPSVSAETIGLLPRVAMPMGMLHAACWLWYAFAESSGEWSTTPSWVRRVSVVAVAIGVIVPWAGLADVPGELVVVRVPELNLQYSSARLTSVGQAVLATMFLLLVPSMLRFVRGARRGEPGALSHVIGFAVFSACGATEALAANGVYRGPHLADVGFVAVIVPVAISAIRRVVTDAARLEASTTQLTGEVAIVTQARDRAEIALLEAERQAALGRLAAGVGHEINNPLTYVRLQLEQLQQWASESMVPPQVTDSLLAIDDGAVRISRIVSDLRDSARATTPRRVPVAVDALLTSAQRIAAHHLARAEQVSIARAPRLAVEGDETRLVQVLVNLLSNAAQAIAERESAGASSIRVELEARAGEVMIRVIDTGVGMDAAQLRRVAEPFATTRSARGGMGLGLFLTRQIIEQHGGTLGVTSSPGAGTTVTVALPRARDLEALVVSRPSAPLSMEERHGDRLRVWLVDDDVRVLESMSRALAAIADVETISSGVEVMARLASEPEPDVLVCDLMMPDVDGIDVAAAVEVVSASLRSRTVFLTGGATTPRALAFVGRPDVRTIYKPVTGRELVQVVLSAAEAGVPA
jgi:signal transduction histidine kinase/ActR/RegA family two-component response regulator